MTSWKNFDQGYQEVLLEMAERLSADGEFAKQYRFILAELDQMKYSLSQPDGQQFSPYYPRGIIDSWDYSDQLGVKLLELLKLYNKKWLDDRREK